MKNPLIVAYKASSELLSYHKNKLNAKYNLQCQIKLELSFL